MQPHTKPQTISIFISNLVERNIVLTSDGSLALEAARDAGGEGRRLVQGSRHKERRGGAPRQGVAALGVDANHGVYGGRAGDEHTVVFCIPRAQR